MTTNKSIAKIFPTIAILSRHGYSKLGHQILFKEITRQFFISKIIFIEEKRRLCLYSTYLAGIQIIERINFHNIGQ